MIDQQNRHESLLDAALRCFAADGFEQTSIKDIIDAVGSSRSTFYKHFHDRHACFVDAYAFAADRVADALHLAIQRAESWIDCVRRSVDAILAVLGAHPHYVRILLIEPAAVGGRATEQHLERMNRLVPYLDLGRECSPCGSELPEDLGRYALGAATTVLASNTLFAGRATVNETSYRKLAPELFFALILPYLGTQRALEARHALFD